MIRAIALALLVAPSLSNAANEGFEDGTSGWTLQNPIGTSEFKGNIPSGTIDTVTSFGPKGLMPAPITAAEGGSFLAVGSLESGGFRDPNKTYDITASQTFHLMAGGTLSGLVAWYSGDFVPQENVFVSVFSDLSQAAIAKPFSFYSNDVDYLTASGWTPWSWSAPTEGLYTLTLGVSTMGDNRLATYGFFDGIRVIAAPVPEPEAFVLFMAGIAATLSLTRRQRRRQHAAAREVGTVAGAVHTSEG